MKQLLLILALMLCFVTAFAQSEDEPKQQRVDFYGYVVTADSLHPIRNTHVISKMAHCGTITDRQGKFHIQARQIDTLWVSCVGYARRLVALDTTLTSSDTLVIRLRPETITLREVTILPFTNYETF
ncbi:MAG: carboxypeptidase-like regulatory domain-containing protein, partial [Prevotella sp.]|nr:carboxypeptidase-like regulatory domain-containing protein [Prevotella sp.]